METITTNTKKLELTGEETQVHFLSAYPYFWVRNDGSTTVQMSISPNIEEGGDGVIEVLAGSSAGTMHGYNATRNDLYLLGSGKVQVMGTYTPENPFKSARKGGDKPDDFDMTGIEARFEAKEEYIDETERSWQNIVPGGNNITWNLGSNPLVHMTDDNAVVITDPYYAQCNYKVKDKNYATVIYAVIKKSDLENDKCILGRGWSYASSTGMHIGLWSESSGAPFLFWASGLPNIKVNINPDEWHLFTFVGDYNDSNTTYCFCDGKYYGSLHNTYELYDLRITLGYIIYGAATPSYRCEYPIYFKFIAIGGLPIKDNKPLTYMDTIYKNMDWIMENIVNPANEEG